ncbi:MAG: hypothetical protein HY364_04775 [Candidatus Aenigmarchaeota archaeon]|nr:hypothetical protein [Candidatus Aenigmarchaeota archaeon]MBS3054512.1 hypothetical protein [Candidatus Aenigmarchaeota archaeon]
MTQDKTAFVEVFGDSPLIKVLDFLMTYREFDYSLSDISKETSVGWNTLQTFFFGLVEKNIVKETRQIGRAKLYKLNEENPVTKKLIELNNAITSRAIDEEVQNQQIKI